ncbi:MAG: GMC family oxidoreductase [Pseudomonadales bacterium]|nr:GMC family oxidoreductase [Pseudomonadales bacterium]
MTQFYDYIIVGSGASGGAMAYYLTKAGAKVLMLEAGKRFGARTFSPNEMISNANLMWSGGTDLTTDAATVLLRGKAVGGGTIINQCLLDRFDDIALDDWKADSDVSFFSSDGMKSHYDEVESKLDLYHLQKSDWNRNAEIYVDGFKQLGLEWSPLRRGQNNCGKGNDCMVCLGGCPRNSKQSTLVTFIPKAEKQGLELISEFDVSEVVHGKNFVTVTGVKDKKVQSFYANKCIMSAGAMGTTQLLLKSKLDKKLPALGKNFHCHPQFMNIGFYKDIVDSHKGSFQSVKSSDPRFREWGFKLENVFAGPIAASLLKPGYGVEHQQFMARYRNMACIEVAVRDQDPGQIRISNSGRTIVTKNLSDADRQRANKGNQLVKDLFHATGAYEVVSSPLQIGLHLMGGARMGRDVRSSVVNEEFKVHGMDNLYVADTALFPNAPGINPMLTTLALSHRAAQSILAEAGHKETASNSKEATA